MEQKAPILIIGAGICGLTLAHELKKAGIAFEIYERDEKIDSRGQEWAIMLHWVLPYLQQMLEPAVYAALDEIQVAPQVGQNDTGNFLFLNLETEEVKFKIPPNHRRRAGREKMRRTQLAGVKDRVHWGKRLVDILPSTDGVTAAFEDGSTVSGSLLVGAEGNHSRTRKFLKPETHEAKQLLVRCVGVAADMTCEQVQPLRSLDPLLFQGSHPTTGTFMWVSMLDVPKTKRTSISGDDVQGIYKVQINLSWLLKTGSDEVLDSQGERLEQMRDKAIGFSPKLKKVIDGIDKTVLVTEIRLTDWPSEMWDNCGGRVTLVGDAAHAMTMYRGEAANHGILDAFNLAKAMEALERGLKIKREALDGYEAELRQRTRPAVLLSRQACLDAHDFGNLNENSAILKKRALFT
ncbi:hypothetical protein MBLNU230_g5438t1 [Neophaeotheca triangularis]